MERERFGSRLGFILISAGCAIGIGNVWKFPYMVGQNGGGIFVLFYLLFLVIFGIPIMTMEFSIGRAAQKSPVKLYQQLEKPGQKWHIHGYVSMAGNYILMMFYTVVCGWMLYYLYAAVTGKYSGMNSEQIGGFFSELLSSPVRLIVCMGIVVAVGFLIISIGLQNGLEKVSKVMMVLLIILMAVLAVNSIFLQGGGEGLKFYLKPDLNKMNEVGIGNVVLGAMTQAFFTLSIGMGAMAIFGSYIGKERSLFGESINIAILDTLVAICSGLIIFPACAAYNIDVTSGPSLLFITLPNVFNHLPGGRIWGSLFFLFMLFAAFSTVLAVFENIISCCMDLFGWSRKKACYLNIIIMFAMALPCALGFNVLSGIHPMGGTSGILDFEDFLVSNLILPLGSLVILFFCVLNKGWGWNNFFKEANTGKGPKLPRWTRGYLTFVLPVIVAIVFIMGIIKI
ncbi:MAG: sodium-dependent transporter [Clostridiales bacterium]|nr:sodium-dependent transporter [Clostridiales bacterium]MDU1042098.1 sodium-dependent transporter [Clostridiales bacterium]